MAADPGDDAHRIVPQMAISADPCADPAPTLAPTPRRPRADPALAGEINAVLQTPYA